MDAMKLQEFEKKYQESNQKYQSYQKKSNQLSFVRFCLFFIMLMSLLIGYFQKINLLYVLSVISLVCFIMTVAVHTKIKKSVLYFQSLKNVYHEHIQRIHYQWDQFEEDGHEFLNDDLSMDLDLFGHHSLFQYINATFTYQGKELLAQNLINHNLTKEKIQERQEALNELNEHENFYIQLQTYGKMIKTKDEQLIHRFINSLPSYHYRQITKYLFIVPMIVFLSFICTLFSIALPYSYILCEIGIVIQFIMTFSFFKQHKQLFEPVKTLHESLQGYYQLFDILQQEKFHSIQLTNIQNKIFKNQHALTGIDQLYRISQGISYRNNVLILIVFNGLGLYDFVLRYFYLKWIKEYGMEIKQWLEALADMELLMSLATPKIDGFDVTQPKIVDNIELSFYQLKHPLIHPMQVVGNHFSLDKHVCIITGSNMSGKTTFMRTIGLNLILAYMGGYVFAENMTCSYMYILTSMRVKDNVEEGISTFYGELLRMKKMIEYSQKNQPMICFIDEIFKGTNSLDRIAGAKATIQKLSVPHCILFITTHDFELCQSQELNVANYHFDEYYDDEKLCFDYLIHQGQSKTTNGQFLLKQLGIM